MKHLKLWWRYSAVPTLRSRVEKVKIKIAWMVPRWLAYWCTIRVGVHATSGQWSGDSCPGVPLSDMLKRW